MGMNCLEVPRTPGPAFTLLRGHGRPLAALQLLRPPRHASPRLLRCCARPLRGHTSPPHPSLQPCLLAAACPIQSRLALLFFVLFTSSPSTVVQPDWFSPGPPYPTSSPSAVFLHCHHHHHCHHHCVHLGHQHHQYQANLHRNSPASAPPMPEVSDS